MQVLCCKDDTYLSNECFKKIISTEMIWSLVLNLNFFLCFLQLSSFQKQSDLMQFMVDVPIKNSFIRQISLKKLKKKRIQNYHRVRKELETEAKKHFRS